MTYTRMNAWELGGMWADPLLWYAKAVAEMKKLPLATKTSWRFYAGIHGFNTALWGPPGYWSATEPMPSAADQKKYWKQCQHGSWFFLPWHRGYLIAFEAGVRAVVIQLGGPRDWALPYWDYFKAGQNKLPAEFAQAALPDGSANALYVPQRYGPNNNGDVYVDTAETDLKAMGEPHFTGVQSGGSRGFGGIDTGFEHGGKFHGQLEQHPHDDVHGMVGGPSSTQRGLMSYPDSAGLDPIFWLHHANIDRLWEIWRRTSAQHTGPADAKWQNGPASLGERSFVMPMPDGTDYQYTPAQVETLAKVNYTYADLSPVGPPVPQSNRLLKLGAPLEMVKTMDEATQVIPDGNRVELMGASETGVQVTGAEARTVVRLNAPVQQKVARSLEAVKLGLWPAIPDRVFLNLENVTGVSDGTRLRVYLNVADGATPADHPELLAGTVALFGLEKASDRNGEHAGQGLTIGLDITDAVDAMHLRQGLTKSSFDVTLVPSVPLPPGESISVGRVSLSRQGG